MHPISWHLQIVDFKAFLIEQLPWPVRNASTTIAVKTGSLLEIKPKTRLIPIL